MTQVLVLGSELRLAAHWLDRYMVGWAGLSGDLKDVMVEPVQQF